MGEEHGEKHPNRPPLGGVGERDIFHQNVSCKTVSSQKVILTYLRKETEKKIDYGLKVAGKTVVLLAGSLLAHTMTLCKIRKRDPLAGTHP